MPDGTWHHFSHRQKRAALLYYSGLCGKARWQTKVHLGEALSAVDLC